MKSAVFMGMLAALLLAPVPAAQAQDASGFFRFKDERGDYSTGVAVRWADPDKPGKQKIGVLLAKQALDAQRGQGEMAPLDAIGQDLGFGEAYLKLGIEEEDGKLRIGHLFASPGGFNTAGNGDEQIRIAGGRITGSWKLAPQSFFDDTYEADFRFDLPLVELKDPGQPLAAGGGEPGKAYSAYIAAVAKGDVEGIKKALAESASWRFSWLEDDNAKARALEDEALHKPVRVTIKGGWVDGDRAMLQVEGPGRFGGSYAGRVMLQREGGAWKVAQQELR
jgi:hypothetical protein